VTISENHVRMWATIGVARRRGDDCPMFARPRTSGGGVRRSVANPLARHWRIDTREMRPDVH
jgi:hypothetical protein